MRTCRHCAGINGRHMPDCTRLVTVPVGPRQLTLTDGVVVETGSGYATPDPTPRTVSFDIDPGTARLLAALRTPARVKVRPLGSVTFVGKSPVLHCHDGFAAECTACGPIRVVGFGKEGRAAFLDTAMTEARRHLKREHGA